MEDDAANRFTAYSLTFSMTKTRSFQSSLAAISGG
jgi:hypothetical protein